jgi:DNA-binding transcriptional LysR family regulator
LLGVELRHLVAFQTVAEEESFSRAAVRLGYTQSAISHQIAALERIVGTRLIERPRGPKRVSLTEAGALLFGHTSRILSSLAAAEADVRSLLSGGRALRLGTFQSVGTKLLPRILKQFAAACPRAELEIIERSHDRDLLGLVASGDLDLAFAVLPLGEGPFDFVELLSDPYVLLVPADSELTAGGRQLTLEDLAQLPLISFERCPRVAQFEKAMRGRGLKPRFVFRSDDNNTAQAMVSAGLGVALLPRLAIEPAHGGIVLAELAVPVAPRVIVLAWHRDRAAPSSWAALLEASRQVCADFAAKQPNSAAEAA